MDADDPAFAALRRSQLIGRPPHSADFIHHAEALLGGTFPPSKHGPKPKTAPDDG